MSSRLSRRQLARHAASQLLGGTAKERVLQQLAAYLVANHREREVDLLARDLETALADHGYIKATVTSARSLSTEAKNAVLDIVQSKYKGAKNIELVEELDASLIGGFKLRLPDSQLDESIKAKLDALTV